MLWCRAVVHRVATAIVIASHHRRPRTAYRPLQLVLTVLLVALMAAGCEMSLGSSAGVYDKSTAEREVARIAKDQIPTKIVVTCPKTVKVEKGKTFTCSVSLPQFDRSGDAKFTIKDTDEVSGKVVVRVKNIAIGSKIEQLLEQRIAEKTGKTGSVTCDPVLAVTDGEPIECRYSDSSLKDGQDQAVLITVNTKKDPYNPEAVDFQLYKVFAGSKLAESVERSLGAQVTKQKAKLANVICPDAIDLIPDSTVTCSGEVDGTATDIEVTIKDEQGNYNAKLV